MFFLFEILFQLFSFLVVVHPGIDLRMNSCSVYEFSSSTRIIEREWEVNSSLMTLFFLCFFIIQFLNNEDKMNGKNFLCFQKMRIFQGNFFPINIFRYWLNFSFYFDFLNSFEIHSTIKIRIITQKRENEPKQRKKIQ